MEISGERVGGARLMAPKTGGMTVRINETLNSSIRLRFSRKKGAGRIYSGMGRNAGLEYVGDVQELTAGFK